MITANTLEKNINNSEETSKLVNPILYREIYQDLSSIAASWSEEEKIFMALL
ncbi:MAG: hypothetical protein HC932_03060 [Thermales bacterium]|nr:hypothetical protein [Thermales bacterium]